MVFPDANAFIVATNKKFLQPFGPLEVEAKAFEEGLIFAWCPRDYS